MHIGLMISESLPGDPTIDDIAAAVEQAERDGFTSVWTSAKFDALTQLALFASGTETIELGTAIVQTYPRHPHALAQQALTVQALSKRRLTLGVGVSHAVLIEDKLGLDRSRPVRHMGEYLTCLRGLLAGEVVTFAGEEFHINGHQLPVAAATSPPPVLVGALGPRMLRVAGQQADGTILWLGGHRYLRDVAIPTISAAADNAGRPPPRVVAGLPVWVTDDVSHARDSLTDRLGSYAQRDVYRAVLDRNGSAGPADVALIGDEAEVTGKLQEYADIGATDVAAVILIDRIDEAERTYQFLASQARAGADIS